MRNEGEVRAKKSFGQHFLTDEKAAAAIVDALTLPAGCTDVLEIGPGMGVLTKYLVTHHEYDLKVVELDRESVTYLHEHFPQLDDKIISGDFLQLDLDKSFDKSFAVIGNFPYNISTQILFRVLENKEKVPLVVGMFQKEVAERIASGPGNRDYGILSVLLQPFYDISIVFTLDEYAFNPPPRVKSAVLKMVRNERTELLCDEAWFKRVVKQGFSQRRKTLRNALRPLLPADFSAIPFLDLRAEALGWKQFEQLAIALLHK